MEEECPWILDEDKMRLYKYDWRLFVEVAAGRSEGRNEGEPTSGILSLFLPSVLIQLQLFHGNDDLNLKDRLRSFQSGRLSAFVQMHRLLFVPYFREFSICLRLMAL
jgi:hypothetical protein